MISNRFEKDKKNIIIVADEKGDIRYSFTTDENNCLVCSTEDIVLDNVLTNNYIILNSLDYHGLLHKSIKENFNDILAKTINHHNHIIFDISRNGDDDISNAEVIVNEILTEYFTDSFYFISGYYNNDDSEQSISVHIYSDKFLPKDKILSIETIVNLTLEKNE